MFVLLGLIRLVVWLVGRLAGWLVGWFVGCCLVGGLVGCPHPSLLVYKLLPQFVLQKQRQKIPAENREGTVKTKLEFLFSQLREILD